MRLSKTQMKIVNELQNGGFIWMAGGHPYLATKDKDGMYRSTIVHGRAFHALVKNKVIAEGEDGHWGLI